MGSKKSQNRSTEDRTPRFHPIGFLPELAVQIDGGVSDADELWEVLEPARERPYVLDDATVERLHLQYSESLEFIALFEEQMRRWSALELTAAQRAEVERLQGQLAVYRGTTGRLLALAAELRGKTIEALLEMDDAEVGLRFLAGEIPRPTPSGEAKEAPSSPPAEEPFRMPPEVDYQVGVDPAGRYVYEFHHRRLGRLGWLILGDRPEGGMDVRTEYSHEPWETLDERKALFISLATALIDQLQRHAQRAR